MGAKVVKIKEWKFKSIFIKLYVRKKNIVPVLYLLLNEKGHRLQVHAGKSKSGR